uniref:HAT C-terminal dimerisation domain-containing protein n=1 Tax=Vitis vinifera TaxID=29760 RepID=A5BE75_VITVI|nr:hypothetical protein VITISV_017567 [Vitis vinifera]
MGYIYEAMDRCKETIKKSFNENEDRYKEIFSIIDRLVSNIDVQDKIICELSTYKNAEGLFGIPIAIRSRKTLTPAEWWKLYGNTTPNLQQVAIKILSLTCSASGCERN